MSTSACTREIKYQVCFLVFFPSGGKCITLFLRFFYLCLCSYLLWREISPKASVRNAIFNVILKGKKVSTLQVVTYSMFLVQSHGTLK